MESDTIVSDSMLVVTKLAAIVPTCGFGEFEKSGAFAQNKRQLV